MRHLRTTAILFLLASAGAASAQEGPPGPSPEAAEQKRLAVQRLLQIIKGEPTVKDVQRWAMSYYKLEPDRLNSMASAARLKGLVPEIEGSFDNMVGHTFTNTRDGLYPILPDPPENPNPQFYKERVSGTNDSYTWRVRAVWNLDRLVFNSEALDVKSLNSLQENLVREVTTMFFARRRLLASLLLSPPQDDEELFYELMRLDEMTSTLDAFTGGKFAPKAWKWDEEEEKQPDKGAK